MLIKKEENYKKLESLRKKYSAIIVEYDIDMHNNKKDMEEKNKEKEWLTAVLENKKDGLDTSENKYQVNKENFLYSTKM